MQELLAKEQQEEQVLRDITGIQRLEDVTFLDAVVDCSETSLSNLGEKMPLLRELKLNNSVLSSVRDLGSKLRQLQVLWISHCGLLGLDGLNALPSLRELYAAFNQIENLEPIADMEKLEVLDLEGNRVDDLGALVYLGWCPQLAVLTLADNPVAQEPTYKAQVCAALPKLQVLDDTKLEPPLSSVWRTPHPHRRTSPPCPQPPYHASLHNASPHTSPQAIAPDAAPHGDFLGSRTALGSDLLQHVTGEAALTKTDVRQSRRQRPASASRLQQRLPPVAVGHNQPGSYLLYSLTQLPPGALHHTAQSDLTAAVSVSASRLSAAAATVQGLDTQGLGHSLWTDSDGGVSGASAFDVRKRRPASAGIRRAESRLQSPVVSESSSRPGSPDGDAGSPAGLEAAGLYWRKHRLLLPQGYTMTVTQAQAAATPATAEAAPSADDTHADTASIATEAQQDAHVTSTVQEQPTAALSQGDCLGDVSTADPGVDSSGGWVNEYDSLAGTEVLIIEDAAELTCDRAAVILRQLSCECEAAASCRDSEAACSSLVAEDEQQTHVPLNQAKAAVPVGVCRTDEMSAVAAVTAGTPLSPEALLDQVEYVAEIGTNGQVSGAQVQPSTSGNAFDAANVEQNSGMGWALPAGQSSSSIETLSACVDASSLQAGSDALQDVTYPSMQLGPCQAQASSMQPASQQGALIPSFLQRLQMSKHADASGSHAASHHNEEGTHGPSRAAPTAPSPRPPSPERPPTPSSRPARRRHLIPEFPEVDAAPSWAGSNRMFAPMPQQLPWDLVHKHATLQVRPASASVAEGPRLAAGSELSWTGSMQLPAGLLKLAARPQQQPVGRKDKHQYDWGFGKARGLV